MFLVTYMVYYVQTIGLDPLQLVLMGTVLEAAILLFEVPTGIVADMFSRRLSIIIGTILMGLSFIAMAFWKPFGLILLAQALWGIGFTFTSGAEQAWITDEIGESNAAAAFLRGTQKELAGAFFGLAAGVLLGSLALSLPMLACGIGYILVALFFVLFMPETGFHPIPIGERNTFQRMTQTFVSGAQVLKRKPVFISILMVGLFLGVYSEGYDRLWTAFLLERFTFPALPVLSSLPNLPVVGWFGLLKLGSILLGLAAAAFTRRVVERSGISKIVILLGMSSLGLVVALAGFSLSNIFFLTILCYWGISVSRQLISPLYTAWVNQRIESSVRATVLSMSSQLDAVGQIIGGPGVGWLARTFGLQVGLLVSTGLLLPVLGFLGFQKHESEGETAETRPITTT
jgi:DHA3 family tetracycline resistance protein-like MFS transporter